MELIRTRYGTINTEFACLFVYCGSVGAICGARNNRGSIFSLLGREIAIKKVCNYGMGDPHMLYKISCPYFIKVLVDLQIPPHKN